MNKKDYQEVIDLVSAVVSEQFVEKESNLVKRAQFIDSDIAAITREIGLKATENVSDRITKGMVEEKKSDGLVVQRNPMIGYNTIFGAVESESPYLWKKGSESKILIDETGIYHNGRREAVDRALCDFRIEESFVQAAKRFEEHYKFDSGSSPVSKVTKGIATKEAELYVENKLNEAVKDYGELE